MAKKFRWGILIVVVILLVRVVFMWTDGQAGHISTVTNYLLVFSLIYLTTKVLMQNDKLRRNILFSTFIFLGALLLGEFVLRAILPQYLSYAERNGGIYTTEFGRHHEGDLHPFKPLEVQEKFTPEYQHVHYYNELGLREAGLDSFMQDDRFLIIGLGDSFTEGIGTPADSTWPAIAEQVISEQCQKLDAVIFNAGMAGSDVFYQYKLLDSLLKYDLRPAVVVVSLNTSDLVDVIIRGGKKRFDEDGDVVYNKGPWWEYFHASNYYIRVFVHEALKYNHLLKPHKVMPGLKKEAEQKIIKLIRQDYTRLAEAYQFELMVILQPLRYEFVHEQPVFVALEKALLKDEDVLVYNSTSVLNKAPMEIDELFWPIDQHFTPQGYEYYGRYVARLLNARFCNDEYWQ